MSVDGSTKRTGLTIELDDAVTDLIERWHGGEGGGTSKLDFLGMTYEQYHAFCNGRSIPGEYRVPERGSAR